MGEFHFLRPHLLWALVPVVLTVWFLFRRQDDTGAWRAFIDPHLLQYMLVGEDRRPRVRPIHLVPFVGLVAVVALAGPAWERERSPFADDQAGLVVLLKASATMEATDVQPSRMQRATQKLRDLLEQRDGAATGLIAYSGSAHLVMPLTRDVGIVSTMGAEISPALMPVDGDALSQALALASELLDAAGTAGSVLVIADTVSPTEAEAIGTIAPDLPVQFLSVQSSSAPVDAGLARAADGRGSAVTHLTFDTADVERVAARARADFRAAAIEGEEEHWRDAGYFLLPLVALFSLPWARKGWVIT
jgi:Ca-activated chloride channel family protein